MKSLLPHGWREFEISNLGDLYTGTTPPTNDRTLYGHEFPFIGPGDLGSRKDIVTAEKNLSKKGFALSRKIPRNSVLFVCIGSTIGKTGIARTELSCNQQINYLIPNQDHDVDFVYYALSFISPVIREQAGEQAVPMVNKSEFGKFLVQMPEIQEQRAIAKALSDIDELIQTLKSERDKNHNLYYSLRDKLILPNFISASLPTDWKLLTLGELGDISGAGVDKINRPDENNIKLLNYMDVYKNLYIDNNVHFTETTATKTQIINANLKAGDVLFTPTSETPEDIAQSSVVLRDLSGTCYSYHLVRFRPRTQMDKSFMAHVFSLRDFRSQAFKAAEGSGTRYVITLPRFRKLLIPVPPVKEQFSIGEKLDFISHRISLLTIELSKYEQVREGMMNDLLTGKVRLV